MITKETIDNILTKVDIERVATDAGLTLHRAGKHRKSLCPFHAENTDSLVFYSETNSYHCFGCGASGDVITFVREFYGLSFYDAVRKLGNDYDIEVVDDYQSQTDEQRAVSQHRESLMAALLACQKFFIEQLNSNVQYANEARVYAYDRWDEDFVKLRGIGFAPNSFDALQKYAAKNSINLDFLQELGLINPRQPKEDGTKVPGFVDQMRGRIVIPIHNHLGQLVGFTARILPCLEEQSGGYKPPKYVNSAESLLFKKSDIVFNLNLARKQARREDNFYLCEGAPDVYQLMMLDHTNVVACLGSSWTDEQFNLLRSHTTNITFIPDIDLVKEDNGSDIYIATFGTGIGKVMKLGQHAMELGFSVRVKDISSKFKNTPKEKLDAGSYFTTEELFKGVAEEDFILWIARKLTASLPNQIRQTIQTLAHLMALLPKEDDRIFFQTELEKIPAIREQKKSLHSSVKSALKAVVDKNVKDGKAEPNIEDKGFSILNNHYVGSGNNAVVRWSNFVLDPLFHIVDSSTSVRLYRITNIFNQTQIVEFKQDEMGSVDKFRNKLESFGNYLWLTRMDNLLRLKEYLYANTPTAYLVSKPGWQSWGFYAFSNGVVYQDEWYEIDEYGIVALPNKGSFYIPALSCINKARQSKRNSFERNFVYLRHGGCSLHDLVKAMMEVYGSKIMIVIFYYISSLFRDVVTLETRNYPILNFYGLTTSGKTALGKFLMAFFVSHYDPVNLRTGTVASIADVIAQSSNALVQIDEYKNSIEVEKVELLKGAWDGVGRTRMSLDFEGRREMTAVDSGIILTGQEMPTLDPALFNRVILLSFLKNQFNDKEMARFAHLQDMVKPGLTHITVELLRHRSVMEKQFAASYQEVCRLLDDALKDSVERRIVDNWAIPLATFHALKNYVHVPFTFQQAFDFAVEGILIQHTNTAATNELAVFWTVFPAAVREGLIYDGADFFIRRETHLELELGKKKKRYNYTKGTEILYVWLPHIFPVYKKLCANYTNREPLELPTLRGYVTASKAFLGTKEVRFKTFVKGAPVTFKGKSGKDCTKSENQRAYIFDYAKLKEMYDISIPKFDTSPDINVAEEEELDKEQDGNENQQQ